jgi:hypothetical protein
MVMVGRYSIPTFSVIIAITLLVVIATTGLQKYEDNPNFKYLVSIGWIITIVSAMLCFLETAIAFPLGYTIIDTCGVLDEVMSSPQSLQKYSHIITQDVTDVFSQCQFGEGDMWMYFKLDELLSPIDLFMA